MDRRFVGSTVALILGSLFLMTAASRGQDAVPQVVSGVGVIVGALAFRSLKRRRLGLCDNSIGRRVAEGIALVAIVALLVLQSNAFARMSREPAPNHVISDSAQLLAYVNPDGSSGG
jgi:hypothetical protein